MAIPLPVPTTHPQTHRSTNMDARSPISPAHVGLYSPFSSSIAMSPQYGNSCALTILKGDAEHPINAHAPIHQKQDSSNLSAPASQMQPSRLATSFSNLRSASPAVSSGFDSSVNIHAVSDHGILLPFLDRPTEVKELLFDTKPNESLMYSLCRVFGGDPEHPTQRGKDERWDEMLELLIELDRPLLDDEDWLARLESLVMERSPALWAQLARCLGADGLTMRPAPQPSSSRFDSWALSSRYVNAAHHNDSPLSAPSAASSDDGHDAPDEPSLSVSVEPLDELPKSFSEQPAGKMQHSSLRQASSPASSPTFLAPEPATATSGQASPGEIFAMSAGRDDLAMSGSLEDIMEEPGSSVQPSRPIPRRARSHSGKFAGLRIQALSSSSPPASRRASNASELSAAAKRDSSSSPLPTGAMSPAGLAPDSPAASPSRTTSTSFSKHRRLSTMMMQNHPTPQQQQQHERSSPDAQNAVSPKAPVMRRQRGASEAAHSLQGHSFQSQPRRRAQSFARSFAELKSPSEHLEQLRAEHAKAEADRLSENTRRISLQDSHTASAPAAPTGALGLHRDSTSSSLLDPSSAWTEGGKSRRASVGRRRVGSVGSKAGASSTGSTSPSLPGLLPDGRTRHPSGSCGSRDLSESIAAFRATMGMSTSPSPSEHNYSEAGDGMSDAGKSSDSANRKRKGSGGAELPKPTSRTANTAEAKISRNDPSSNAEQYQSQFEQPKHMQELETRNKASGASGSGLALGGGFSLAKSGANFRRQSHDSAPTAQGGWRSSLYRRDGPARTRGAEPYSFRSPPAVHRRPGGFVSLAQEYERTRQHRRSSETAFSIHSNAVASSPSSSLASLDLGGSEGMGRSHRQGSEDPIPRLELEAATPGDPTPKAGPGGGITPRPSFVSSSTRFAGGGGGEAGRQQEGYPFPNLSSRSAAPLSDDVTSSDHLAPATPLSPLQACRTRLSPSLSAPSTTTTTSSSSSSSTSPRSPSIVFPISPNPSISRAHAFQKTLLTPRCQSTFNRIRTICGPSVSDSIRSLITNTERASMPDEELLEQVARRLGLVDHERARLTGGTEAEEADIILAEEGYQDRWDVFAELCRNLGVGEYELALARKRCGPAIDLSGGNC
ncbi:uncharacterized protein UTRI_04593 [Ustilago trichophora]|uniref:Uncharacterized protein n=1 Tax=Ustilago trichophora TaxID=86804 RepID=A0A5C3EF96_9BASI|nr:uncharacterized protein UTRI_04593 [Ustilago trichophora]